MREGVPCGVEGWDDVSSDNDLDVIMSYIDANTDQELLSSGRIINSFNW